MAHSATERGNSPSPSRIRILPATHRKIKRIAKLNRWTLTTTVDLLADYYLAWSVDGETILTPAKGQRRQRKDSR